MAYLNDYSSFHLRAMVDKKSSESRLPRLIASFFDKILFLHG
ncbi:hypothetical protein ASZ90_006959 [hydrocarbon metagenome]|uniref:Uncharacterized protein n=1 Tax=hydrocarbon metagenome TaxID=938273 RepID=A0A0W8FRD1_9ZZZZ